MAESYRSTKFGINSLVNDGFWENASYVQEGERRTNDERPTRAPQQQAYLYS